MSFESVRTISSLGSWTISNVLLVHANNKSTWPTQYTNSLPTYANIPVKIFATYLQDDWRVKDGLTLNLGVRYDVEYGSFNEKMPGLLAKIQGKLGRDGSFPLDVSVVQPASTR